MNFLAISFTLLIGFNAYSNDAPIEAVSECRTHHIENNCEENEDVAKAKAIGSVKTEFDQLANAKELAVSNSCDAILNQVLIDCDSSVFSERQKNIDDLVGSFSALEQKKNDIYRSRAPDSESRTKSVVEIISELKSLSVTLGDLSDEMDNLKSICDKQRDQVKQDCSRPTVKATEINNKLVSEGDAIAQARIANDIVLKVGNISQGGMDKVDRTQKETTEVYRTASDITNTAIGRSENYQYQIRETIRSLNGLVTDNNDDCDASAMGGCEEGLEIKQEPEPEIEVVETCTDPNGCTGEKPEIETETTHVAASSSAGQKTTEGLSGEELISDANSKAYGTTTNASADRNSSQETSGNGFAGGINSAAGGLGGLGSIFGKTGGGFGQEGYSNPSNPRYQGSNYSNYNSPNQNQASQNFKPNYDNNRLKNPSSNSQNTPNFGGGNYANSANRSAPVGGGQGAGGLQGSSAPTSKSSSRKPGLLSRLFGKKKDKTLFGKTDSSARGGSFKSRSNRSSSRTNSNLNSENQFNPSNSSQRRFDASKYEPSKAASARAYARATGRKIASQAPQPEIFVWPDDISKNRNANMFSKVRISHKVHVSPR